MSDDRPVRDRIPPEDRLRARKAGFSAEADWYAGRRYDGPDVDPVRAEDNGRGPHFREARMKLRRKRWRRRRESSAKTMHSMRAWVAGLVFGRRPSSARHNP